jgi:lysophospholipase L1-like esterase
MADTPLRGLVGDRATIVLFGDSLTQRGWGPDGWCSDVAHLFQRQADVYNRGYGGYNTRWALHLAPYLLPLTTPTTQSAHITSSGGDAVSTPALKHPTPQHYLVTVWFGANDAAAPSEGPHVPLGEFESNLRAIVSHAVRASLHVVVLTPPPVHEATRLAFQRAKFGPAATGVAERSNARVEPYAAAARRVARDLGVPCLDVHGAMLAEGGGAAWPAFVGAAGAGEEEEEGDGLHLSRSGQRFVARRLVALLVGEMGLDPAALPTELPLGSAVDPAAFAASLLDHQRAARALGAPAGNGLFFATPTGAGVGGAPSSRPPPLLGGLAFLAPVGWVALGAAAAALFMRATSARTKVLGRAE